MNEDAKTTALNKVFRRATNSDSLRQWHYPNMPDTYEVRPKVLEIAEDGQKEGKTAGQIEADIMAAYEADEKARLSH